MNSDCHDPPQPEVCRACKIRVLGGTVAKMPEKRGKIISERLPFKGFGRRSLPCYYESSIVDHNTGDETRHVRLCANPKTPWNRCTRLNYGAHKADVQACDACPAEYYIPRTNALEWVSLKRLTEDSVLMASMLPSNISAVIGVPRSGMIPAAIISAYLHVPLGEVAKDGQIRSLHHGSRGYILGFGNRDSEAPALVVDDTVYSGTAMRRVRETLTDRKLIFGAIYCNPLGIAEVDIYVKRLAGPHLLEWNVFNNPPLFGMCYEQVWLKGGATDLDGILCHDELSPGIPGTPYMVPRRKPLKLICTGRYEMHRAGTETWLRDTGVAFERLEMLPDGETQDARTIAKFKAKHFKESQCGIFFESCPTQARIINQFSDKPVACPIISHVFQ